MFVIRIKVLYLNLVFKNTLICLVKCLKKSVLNAILIVTLFLLLTVLEAFLSF